MAGFVICVTREEGIQIFRREIQGRYWFFRTVKVSLGAVIRPGMTSVTFSSSKLSVKCRISANCLARACSLSRCCIGAYGGLVNASRRLRKAFSANTLICQKYTNASWNLFTAAAAGQALISEIWPGSEVSLFLPDFTDKQDSNRWNHCSVVLHLQDGYHWRPAQPIDLLWPLWPEVSLRHWNKISGTLKMRGWSEVQYVHHL